LCQFHNKHAHQRGHKAKWRDREGPPAPEEEEDSQEEKESSDKAERNAKDGRIVDRPPRTHLKIPEFRANVVLEIQAERTHGTGKQNKHRKTKKDVFQLPKGGPDGGSQRHQ
jgi:hypothetical protein